MAGGLVALLDDIAALAKVAAASLDDIAAGAARAGVKSAGVIIDDAAVTPQYVKGISPKRELPVVWRIARGSFFNKFIIIIPVALLLSWLAPQLLPWLLIFGGSYLCYEGAVKVLSWFGVHTHGEVHSDSNFVEEGNSKETENRIVRSAITTDLVLSAEIMLISMSNIDTDNWIMRLLMLILVAIAMTLLVYGAVGFLVKVDDIGLSLALNKRVPKIVRKFGFGMVHVMPTVFNVIGVVGTIAMLWVGGHIVAKSLYDVGWHFFYDIARSVEHFLHDLGGFVVWFGDTIYSAVLGLGWGLILVPVFWIFSKIWGKIKPQSKKPAH